MTIDIELTRADTLGCRNVLHFNNAGSALPTTPVLTAVVARLTREAEIGGYEAAAEAEMRIEQTYDAVALLLNYARDEVALVEIATRASMDMAFNSLRFSPGDRILTRQAEYASNVIAFLQVAGGTAASQFRPIVAGDGAITANREPIERCRKDAAKTCGTVGCTVRVRAEP